MNRNARTGKVFLLESSITLKLLFPITDKKKFLSEVGFEPTPGEPDCDLNAAP